MALARPLGYKVVFKNGMQEISLGVCGGSGANGPGVPLSAVSGLWGVSKEHIASRFGRRCAGVKKTQMNVQDAGNLAPCKT
eukprot:3139015-Pyramimonas_sp.AAC.1